MQAQEGREDEKSANVWAACTASAVGPAAPLMECTVNPAVAGGQIQQRHLKRDGAGRIAVVVAADLPGCRQR